jgi:hypothetical protein
VSELPTWRRRAAVAAAVVHAACWPLVVVFLVVVNPLLGIADPTQLADPAVVLPVVAATPGILVLPGLDLFIGVSLATLAVLTSTLAPALRLVAPAGIVAGTLFVALATSRLAVYPVLADLRATDAATADSLYRLADALHAGVTSAIHLFVAIWLVGVAVAAWRSGRVLAVVALVVAAVNVVAVAVAPAAAPNALLVPLTFVLLAVWVGRRRGAESATA